jgi:peroxiredoxin
MAGGLLYLAYQNVQLKRQLAEVAGRLHASKDMPTVRSGDIAPPFTAFLPDGQELVVRTDSLSAPLILAWLSYDCEPCVVALDRWNLLADRYPGQVWGIEKGEQDTTDSSFSSEYVRFTILIPTSDTVFSQYRISATPQTMIVMEDGTIEDVWLGPLNDDAANRIMELMQQPFVERR